MELEMNKNDKLKEAYFQLYHFEQYADCDDFKSAESAAFKAIALYRSVYPNDHGYLIRCIFGLALLYHYHKKIRKAEACYLEALDECRKLYSDGHIHLVLCLFQIGGFYDGQNRISKAKAYYSEALEAYRELIPKEQGRGLYLPEMYFDGYIDKKLVHIYGQQINTKNTDEIFKNAFEMLDEIQRPRSIANMGLNLYYFGTYFKDHNYFEEARLVYLKALEFIEKFDQENLKTEYLREVYHDLAVIHDDNDYIQEAISFYLKELEIYRKIILEDKPEESLNLADKFITSLSYTADLCVKFEQSEQAASLLIEEFELLKGIYPDGHEEYSEIFKFLKYTAYQYDELRSFEKSEPLYLAALEIHKEYVPQELEEVAQITLYLGENYQFLGHAERADEFYLKALATIRELYAERESLQLIDFVESYSTVISFYMGMNEFHKAEPLLIEGIQYFRDQHPEGHDEHVAMLQDIETCYKKLGQPEKGEPFAKERYDLLKKLGVIK